MSTAIYSNQPASSSTLRTTNSSNPSQIITYSPTSPTVNYDTNVTPLYAAIGNSDWETATTICEGILSKLEREENVLNEAAVWVVRTKKSNTGEEEILWRFLPIHSTCALSPPHSFLRLLIKLHPSSVKTVDHQGLLPLHYACGSQSSRECVYTLLMAFPQGSLVGDPRGRIPLHYLGQWGPNCSGGSGSSGIVEMMCVASGEMGNAKVRLFCLLLLCFGLHVSLCVLWMNREDCAVCILQCEHVPCTISVETDSFGYDLC